jgi:hypothetical protein
MIGHTSSIGGRLRRSPPSFGGWRLSDARLGSGVPSTSAADALVDERREQTAEQTRLDE